MSTSVYVSAHRWALREGGEQRRGGQEWGRDARLTPPAFGWEEPRVNRDPVTGFRLHTAHGHVGLVQTADWLHSLFPSYF